MHDLWTALALVLVLEGVLPFLRPESWRKTMGRIASQNNGALRVMGLTSMLLGLFLLKAMG
jgi:hypothetical protein